MFVILFQACIGIVSETGLFGNLGPYENKMTEMDTPDELSAMNEWEQIKTSVSVFNQMIDLLTWGWIKNMVKDYYDNDEDVRALIDKIIWMLRLVSGIIIGGAIIEFWRNRTDVV
jgi:hypothetical protein